MVTKPVEGAQKDGIGGFFVGVGKGASGLVGKVVSGTVDILAKTSEGIDNQTKSNFQLSIRVRIRNPRPFYESNFLLKPYNSLHANWLLCVPRLHKDLEVPTFYDLVCVPEEVVTREAPPSGSERQLAVHRSHIFIVTKYVLIHAANTVKLVH